ncbi:MAG: phosphatase PAP2 family protein [Cytophagaceae bacterium]
MPRYLFLIAFIFNIFTATAQDTNRVTIIQKPYRPWYKGKVVKASIAPLVLIGLGTSVINDRGIYSSYQARDDIRRLFPNFRTRVDDVLIIAPYIQLVALNLAKIPCRNDFINTSLLIVKTELIMAAIVFPVKRLTEVQRPDSSDFRSFPSGHTAQAFAAATIIHKEFRYKSPWYGVGAYAIASSVAFFRMANNRHWLSDVLAGAGVGILSAQIAYLTHQHRWGRRAECFAPFIMKDGAGLCMYYSF